MVRGGGWLFLELGRRIERAQAVAAIGTAVAGLSDRITRRYFALLPVAQTIGVADDDEGEEPHQAPDREADHVAEVVS